jgi:hypothetical protein
MDARGGRATSGAFRLENRQTFDRPEIKTDRVSNSQATGHLEQTPARRAGAEGQEMNPIPWTPKEDERLRALALSGASVAEMSKQMKRSEEAVRSRAYRLKIVLAKSRMGPKAKGK